MHWHGTWGWMTGSALGSRVMWYGFTSKVPRPPKQSELVEEVNLVHYWAHLSIWMARVFAGPLLRFVWCVFFRMGVLVFFGGF